MNPQTYALVLASAVTHASWNLLLKWAKGGQQFIGLSKLVETAILLPVLILLAGGRLPDLLSLWYLPLVGAFLVFMNYGLLARAYRVGDLSYAYTISRGAMLLFLPPLAYAAFGERPSFLGWSAIGGILLGILCLQLPSFSLQGFRQFARGTLSLAALLALGAALTAALYTIWDKNAVQHLSPVTYFASYTVLLTGIYAPTLLSSEKSSELAQLWQTSRWPIVAVGVLNTGSYLLALAALQHGSASYVIAVRQLSIALGAILGWWLLKEKLTRPRLAGICLVTAGCVLLSFVK